MDSSGDVAADAGARGSCWVSLQTYCSVNGQQWGDPNVHQSDLENPRILFPRDVVVLPSWAEFPLGQRSRASFCLSRAVSTQPLEAACGRLTDPLNICLHRKVAGKEPFSFFPFHLCCPAKTLPWKSSAVWKDWGQAVLSQTPTSCPTYLD